MNKCFERGFGPHTQASLRLSIGRLALYLVLATSRLNSRGNFSSSLDIEGYSGSGTTPKRSWVLDGFGGPQRALSQASNTMNPTGQCLSMPAIADFHRHRAVKGCQQSLRAEWSTLTNIQELPFTSVYKVKLITMDPTVLKQQRSACLVQYKPQTTQELLD